MRQSLRAREHRATRVSSGSDFHRPNIKDAVSSWFEALEVRRLFAAVLTDKSDYAFGEVAQITGSQFQPGETVQFRVTHAEGTGGNNADPQNQAWTATDGGAGDLDGLADGNVQTTWVVDDPDAVGATYVLSAEGLTSGELATTTFTDANITVSTNKNWSQLTGGSGPGGLPNGSDAITINNGATLTVDVNNALVGTINISSGTLLFTSGGQVTVNNTLTVSSGSSINMAGGGLLRIGGAGNSSTGALHFNGTGSLVGGTGTVEFFRSSGEQWIGRSAYNNVLISGGGTKKILPSGSFTANGVVTLANNVIFSLHDAGTANIGGLATSGNGDGAKVTNNGALNLNINVASGTQTYAGAITSNNDLQITKNGNGTQVFAGMLNTYKGILPATTVNAGVLLVNGAHIPSDINKDNYLVNSNGTLGGIGAIHADVTVNGTMNPGVTVGTLQVRNKNVSFGANSFYHADLAMNGATPVADQLHVNNSSGSTTRNISVNSLAALNLSISSDFTAAVNDSFTIINNATGGSTGTFNAVGKVNGVNTTLSDNATFTTANDQQFRVDYVGNDLVLIYLGQANVAPVAQNGSNTTSEDTAVDGSVAVTDGDGDSLTYSLVGANGGATNGTVVLDPDDGAYTYTPNANYNGSDSFSFKANDGNVDSNVATVTITITSVNDAPVAGGDSYGVNEDATLNGSSVLANDSDTHGGAPHENNSPLTAVLVDDVEHGTLLHNADGTFTYTPDANYFGSDSFTYCAQDSLGGQSAETTVSISVAEVNDAPAVAADLGSVTVSEGYTATNTGTYSDIDGGNVTITASVGNITKTGTTSGTWNWSLGTADGPNQSQTVTITANDGKGGVTTTSFALTVNNVAPTIAISGAASVSEGSAYSLTLGAVTDPGADTITSYIVHWGDGSTSSYASGGNVTHTYADGANSDDITIDLVDEDGTHVDRANAHNVTVSNVAPTIAISGSGSANEGSAYSLTLGAVTDPGTDTVASYVVHWGDGSSNTYTSAGAKSHIYADGPNSYNVTVDLVDEDGTHLNGANAHGVTVSNVSPTATANAYTLGEDTSASGNVITNDTGNGADSDPAGTNDPLVVSAVNGNAAAVGVAVSTAHGTVTVNANGTFNYTPDANYFGTDSFTYTISDGNGGTATATVQLTINEVNDAPVATADAYTTNEDTPLNGDVLDNDTDPDNTDGFPGNEDTLSTALVAGPSHGTLVLNANGTFTYTPAANFFGTDSFTYTVSDGTDTDTGTVTITVSEVNDAPVAVDDTGSTTQDTATSGNVLANDTDPDNSDTSSGNATVNEDTLTAVPASGNTAFGGTFTVLANGDYTYTPALGFFGTDSFAYTVTDGTATDTGTVTITVAPAAPNSIYLRPDHCVGGMMLIINGSAANDNLHVAPATGGGVVVHFNGVAQDTYFPTGRIIVFGYAGDDQVTIAGAVTNVAWIYGDDGHDLLNLGNGGGIAWGGDGNDHINGGSARDIMIGGEGGDRIVGNAGDDILIAGLTTYDDRFTKADHEEAWCHIYEEWNRKDSAGTYEQRIDHLKGPTAGGTAGGCNGAYFLNNSTVNDDNAYDQIDMLTGAAGEDWFLWTKGEDKVTGMSSTEGSEDLDCIS